MGGIWQGGNGLSADSNGYVYAMTGNGKYATSPYTTYYAESFLQLTAGIGAADPNAYYRDPNWNALDTGDTDLGSGGPVQLSGLTVPALIGGGKQGYLYTIGTSNMLPITKFFATYSPDSGITDWSGAACNTQGTSEIKGGAAYYGGFAGGFTHVAYVWGEHDYVKAFQVTSAGSVAFDGNTLSPTLCGTPGAPGGSSGGTCGAILSVGTSVGGVGCGGPGGMLSVSSDGAYAGTGIVWASHQKQDAETNPSASGRLIALDAADLNKELWDSDQVGGNSIASLAKFVPPTVANGRVYMATFDGMVRVYGLLTNLR